MTIKISLLSRFKCYCVYTVIFYTTIEHMGIFVVEKLTQISQWTTSVAFIEFLLSQ